METRNSQKRKESQDKQELQDLQPPAKRTRSQSRQTKAPAPPAPPRSTRSQRTARPQSTRTKPTPGAGASTQQAASIPLAEDSPRPSPDATASAPQPLVKPTPSSMDASGRRGSRGEAPSSGGEDDRVRMVLSCTAAGQLPARSMLHRAQKQTRTSLVWGFLICRTLGTCLAETWALQEGKASKVVSYCCTCLDCRSGTG